MKKGKEKGSLCWTDKQKRKEKRERGLSTTKERGDKVERALLFAGLKREWWAIRVSLARSLNTRVLARQDDEEWSR